jgi:acetolactate synthase-1/2/3 large subunit
MAIGDFLERQVSVPEAIARVLEQAGIDMVFGMPGGNAMMIFDALYDHASTIRTVAVRQESLAGVMAEVYGRLTGKPGVALGQGAFMLTNALLGTLEAHMGCSPMLVMADLSDGAPFSHHAPYQAGTGEAGTWDAKKSFEGVTKRTMVLHEPVQAVQGTQYAAKHAILGEAGPIALLYHSAALKGRVDPNAVPHLYDTKPYLRRGRQPAAQEAVSSAAELLVGARQPVIVAGNGVRISRAYSELQVLAELLGAPVATTAAGKGVFPETHDLSLGVFGTFGLPAANALVAEADVLLVVGSRLSPTDTAFENPRLIDPRRQSILQIDIEPGNACWAFPCEEVLSADAAKALAQLHATIESGKPVSEETVRQRKERAAAAREQHGFFNAPEYDSDELPMLPQRVIAELRRGIAGDAIVTCDAGENRLFMTHFFQTTQAGTLLSPAAIGGMGYAIPAALAAKLVHPDRQVVAVCGDGGFAMAMNGLLTAVDENIPIVALVLNNSSLGWVMHGQKERAIASQLRDTRYDEIARAMGCRGLRVENPAELTEALNEARSADRPVVLDVVTSPRVTFEWVLSDLAAPARSA